MDKDKQNILDALECIPAASLSYDEWLAVGMALKTEGFDLSVWDSWSRSDSRYNPKDCTNRWKGFSSSGECKGGSIVHLAKQYGYSAHKQFEPRTDWCMGWNDYIQIDEIEELYSSTNEWSGTSDLKTYLETLFKPDDIVGYVTGTAFCKDGKWMPDKGVYTKTCAEIIEQLDKHPDDITYAVGDYSKEAGAWIRFNPLDGQGAGNTNVVDYRYALVESDTMPIEEQRLIYTDSQMPIAALVLSGGKSLHAIVKINASNEKEYTERVLRLYDFLKDKGLEVDKANKNCSRLSRMPGVYRNGNKQMLVATNIGKPTWEAFEDVLDGISDELPAFENLASTLSNPIELSPPLIEGILRQGHKLLISGDSKSGKSFLLMEAAIAIATGGKWLGRQCKKSNVLIINLEIDSASYANRFKNITEAMNIQSTGVDGIDVWNLRGYSVPLTKLTPLIIRRVKQSGKRYGAIIIDPIYKVSSGDENKASDMAAFCNQFDVINLMTGAAVLYAHHHSKGSQGGKKAIDRASGSGVFARDPDAILDLIQIMLPPGFIKPNYIQDYATPWRIEGILREFAPLESIDMWFDYPTHKLDEEGILKELGVEGSASANLMQSGKRANAGDTMADKIRDAYNTLTGYGLPDEEGKKPFCKLSVLSKSSGIDRRTIEKYITGNGTDSVGDGWLSDEFYIEEGLIFPKE